MDEKAKPSNPKINSNVKSKVDLTAAQAIIDAIARGDDVDVPLHPAATILPRLLKEQLDELAADIKERGLEHPITLHPNGSILDGVNRYKACRVANVKPRFEIWKGRDGEEIDFVISKNLLRRHLSERQRSIAAAKLAKLKRGQRKQADLPIMTQREAAVALNVSERNVRTARKIVDQAPPNIVTLVEQDQLSLRAAEVIAKASVEDKARVASMTDEEALATANGLTKKNDASLAKEAQNAASLIRRLNGFLAVWIKATDDARAELIGWLQQEPNAAALEALRTVAVSPRQTA
jgi:ParB-like chromosome segregation protein Spo0J